MIRLKDLLNELEVGDVLLGEPIGKKLQLPNASAWKELGIPYEPNTIDEKQLIDLLRNWIVKEIKNPKLVEFLKQLLPLKSKFPKILDPAEGRELYTGTSFYRGTLIPMKDVLKLSSWEFTTENSTNDAIQSKDPYTWTPASQKGFTSVTPSIQVAGRFTIQYMTANNITFSDMLSHIEDGSGMIPVIIEINDTHPNIIMNPKVMNLIGTDLYEDEVFMIVDHVKVKSVIIPNWKYIEKAAVKTGVDLSKYFKIS